jgi:hypothetical protein
LQEILDRINTLNTEVPLERPAGTEDTRPPRPAPQPLPKPLPKRPAPRTEQPQPPPPPPAKEGDVTLAAIEDAWVSLIRGIRIKKMSVATYLSEGKPISYEGEVLTLGFPEGRSFHREALEDPQSRKLIEDTIQEMLGVTPVLKFVITKEEPKEAYAVPDEPLEEMTAPPAETKPDPLIDSALDIFGGKVVHKRKQEA